MKAEASRVRKFLFVSPQPFCLLTKADGSWTDSEKESLNLLLDTHMPGSESAETTILAGICSNAHVKYDKITDNIFTPENLNWAINSFNPFKTPGPDGIHPITTQKAESLISEQLIWLYKGCLTLGYIPQKWRLSEVSNFPKARKKSHTA